MVHYRDPRHLRIFSLIFHETKITVFHNRADFRHNPREATRRLMTELVRKLAGTSAHSYEYVAADNLANFKEGFRL